MSRRLQTLYCELLASYGPQGWWPVPGRAGARGFDSRGYHPGDYRKPADPQGRFDVAVGAVLTQNTAWSNVEQAMERLAAAGVRSPADVLACPPGRLARLVRPSGYYNAKARKLRELAAFFAARSGSRPPGREQLLAVWGVGEETADSILLYAFRQPVFVIDTYTRRFLARHGLAQGSEPYAALQAMFHEALGPAPDLFNEYHALIVRHQKRERRARPRPAAGTGATVGRLVPKRPSRHNPA